MLILAPDEYLVARAAIASLRHIVGDLHAQAAAPSAESAVDTAALARLEATVAAYGRLAGLDPHPLAVARPIDELRTAEAVAGRVWHTRMARLEPRG